MSLSTHIDSAFSLAFPYVETGSAGDSSDILGISGGCIPYTAPELVNSNFSAPVYFAYSRTCIVPSDIEATTSSSLSFISFFVPREAPACIMKSKCLPTNPKFFRSPVIKSISAQLIKEGFRDRNFPGARDKTVMEALRCSSLFKYTKLCMNHLPKNPVPPVKKIRAFSNLCQLTGLFFTIESQSVFIILFIITKY
ncbi:hypothetical protein HMPREF1006_02588 [Synergistes sp. 3_1_syn1]|nr:hypothetical protein HMPREF1006_02588 [Synergistes sp. 3_1_syn1]